ncbi:N-6 DNA methylase [Anabaena sp. CCY 0017]|uniref:N-6 DNA methylase n=1 Tax=Anabaena sp. CCY 0017 TaxID=3103866 RepID=UPI0039C69409
MIIVFDPACGTADFSTATIDYIRQHFQSADVPEILQRTIRGTEKKPLPYNLCNTNLILHGIDVPVADKQSVQMVISVGAGLPILSFIFE